MAGEPRADSGQMCGQESGQDAIEAESLRKAEEFIEQDEGATNRLTGSAGLVVTCIAVAMSLFHLYAAYEIVPTQELRYTHVAFVLLLAFLLFPMATRFRDRIRWWDVIAGLTCVGILIYAIVGGEDFTDRATLPNRTDVILGVIFIVLLIEATRRTVGWIVPFISLLFIAYALAGLICRRRGIIAATASTRWSGICSSRWKAFSVCRSMSRRR